MARGREPLHSSRMRTGHQKDPAMTRSLEFSTLTAVVMIIILDDAVWGYLTEMGPLSLGPTGSD